MRVAVAGGTGVVGKHVVAALSATGHDPVVLSRSSGVDLVDGTALREALVGAAAVVDVASTGTTGTEMSVEFFGGVTRRLLEAEQTAGVAHHLALSIVGIDGVDTGYYAGKLIQEQLVADGPVPWTMLRATQFHEFAEQLLGRVPRGPIVPVPRMLMRPVAAREVGAALAALAVAAPAGRVPDLAGPEDETLVDLVRRMLAFDGVRRRALEVRIPGRSWRAAASGALRGRSGITAVGPGFDAWLRSPDHSRQSRLRASAWAAARR